MTTPPAPALLAVPPAWLDHIRTHTTAAVPLTHLLGVLLDILGQETLIANDTPAPAYLLIFLDTPVPLVGQP